MFMFIVANLVMYFRKYVILIDVLTKVIDCSPVHYFRLLFYTDFVSIDLSQLKVCRC